MIIKCENCGTKFRLADFLLKRGGSKVRCTRCDHVFTAYPPQRISGEEDDDFALSLDELDESPNADSEPDKLEDVINSEKTEQDLGFDDFFTEPVDEPEEVTALPLEPEEEETVDDKIGRSVDLEEDFFSTSIEEQEKEVFGESFETDAMSGKKMRGKSRFFTVFITIFLLFVGVSAAVFFLAPEWVQGPLSFLKSSKKQEIKDSGSSRLGFKAVTGDFVVSDKSGQLFVIRGVIVNNYPRNRSFILVRGKILDSKGKTVRNKTAYAGNTYTDQKIKRLSMDEIDAALKNRYGMGRKNLKLAPGASINFMIVFENLPENMSEFVVEAVSSIPGK